MTMYVTFLEPFDAIFAVYSGSASVEYARKRSYATDKLAYTVREFVRACAVQTVKRNFHASNTVG